MKPRPLDVTITADRELIMILHLALALSMLAPPFPCPDRRA
ncbi:hypothetical protein OV203_46870 [Nannocystis sp. ILAH1]|nr:hypothetical protein [Nannocystis sp. ILAH1]MCY0994739.1 hypothetical protein [Nannocystis sp. ILAH1]